MKLELWKGCKPDVSYFRMFGSPAFTHVKDELRRKLDPKAVECVFVGYCENSKSFRICNPATRKTIIRRDVIFKKETVNKQVSSGEVPDYDSFLFSFWTAEPVHDRGDVEVTLLQQNNYLFATPTLLHQNEGAEEHHESQIEPNEVEEIPAVDAADNKEEVPALDIADNQENPAPDIVDNQEEALPLGTVDNQKFNL